MGVEGRFVGVTEAAGEGRAFGEAVEGVGSSIAGILVEADSSWLACGISAAGDWVREGVAGRVSLALSTAIVPEGEVAESRAPGPAWQAELTSKRQTKPATHFFDSLRNF